MNMFRSTKVEHPTGDHSHHLSQKVEKMNHTYLEFQNYLNDLVMLYKTRHQLMDALNENGLYAAKCYYEMFDETPLSAVLAPRDKFKAGSPDRIDSMFLPAELAEEESVFPSSSIIGGVVESPSVPSFDEGEFVTSTALVRRESSGSTNPFESITRPTPPNAVVSPSPLKSAQDPEGVTEPSIEVPIDTAPVEHTSPSTDMRVGYSDNVDGALNVIVDDEDDSFTDFKKILGETEDELMPKSEKKTLNDTKDNGLFNQSLRSLVVPKISKSIEHPDDEPFYVVKDIKTGEEHKVEGAIYGVDDIMMKDDDEFPVTSAPESQITTSNSDEVNQKDEYLNISNDGSLVKYKATSPRKSKFNSSYNSYHDVHKDLFMDTKIILDEFAHIVQYVEDWKKIVEKCVGTMYGEYSKCRSGTVHYEKKVLSLQADIDKLRNKEKQIPPKQIAKLERNEIKLDDTRKTHDKQGESLLMLLDEVVLRSWRDALPLLRKSIKSEVAFVAKTQEHMEKLGAPLKLLEIIGGRETVTPEGRLTAFESCNIEDIYTGKRNFASD